MKREKWISILSDLAGIDAVVIGGSGNREKEEEETARDAGIYYNQSIDWLELENALKVLMDETPLAEKILYQPGEWGPWINGGAWLTVDGQPYNVALRETNKVKEEISSCVNGEITVDYQPGYPSGFLNTVYAAEVHHADILWERASAPVSQLQKELYAAGTLPEKMKAAILTRFLFEAEYTMESSRKAARKGDMHYAVGCFYRTVASWNQILFALNDVYFLNEKGSLQKIKKFALIPNQYLVRVNQAYDYFAHFKPMLGFSEFELLQRDIEKLIRTYGQNQQKG